MFNVFGEVPNMHSHVKFFNKKKKKKCYTNSNTNDFSI